jgi:hypothetical protein
MQSLILCTALLMLEKPLSIAHHDLMGDIEMNFTDTVNPNVNVVFFLFRHGKSISFLKKISLQVILKLSI